MNHTPQDGRPPAKHLAARVIRWVAARRRFLPGPVDRGLDWLRWHLPRALVARLTGSTGPPLRPQDLVPGQSLPPLPDTTTRLFIGPANFAGQAHLWVGAASRYLPDTGGVSFGLHVEGGFDFPSDYLVTPVVYRKNRPWQRALFTYVATGFTHVIIEAMRPLFADLHRLNPVREARALTAEGVNVAMMAHGTDVRLPSRHRELHPWSPFADRDWDAVGALQVTARRNIARLERYDGPVFVSTPDLLEELPFAVWCPVVVEPERWRNDRPLLEQARPLVVHAPSNSRVKGTSYVDQAMQTLEAEGLLSYHRVEGVPSADMPAIYAEADIVLEQFRLGSYGVAACEAMAAGKVVVGNVTDAVREQVGAVTGQQLPIVQATPDRIEAVVRGLVADRPAAIAAGSAGPAFVREAHDGRLAARQLSGFLGAEPT